jgi:glycosyltransferase involved in cell wall biosynthesis
VTRSSSTITLSRPLVSVCMPAHNGERWIEAAIESVLAQTYQNFELVISDDGSIDATAEIGRSYGDPRIRVEVTPWKLDAISNWNRSVLLARAEYIKFLHQDDTIYPTCLEEMVSLALEDPEIGLVFAPRKIVLGQPSVAEGRLWAERYGNLHHRFRSLARVNDGRDLFRQILDVELAENWIGEPSSVLVTRRCLAQIGLFNPRLRQVPDLDLWCRAMLRYRVGFIDRPLSTYLHHTRSLTGENERLGRAWLDRLWLFEGLLGQDLSTSEDNKVRRLRNQARRAAIRAQAGRLARRRFSRELADYAVHWARTSVGRAPSLHPVLADSREPVNEELLVDS